jgi:hypothetical protein
MKTKIVVLAAILILLTGVVFAQEEGWTPSVGFQYSLGMKYNSVTGGEYLYGFDSGNYVGATYSGETFDAQVQARLEGQKYAKGPFVNQLWVTWKPTEVVSIRAGLTDPVTAAYSSLAYTNDGNWAYGATAGDTVLGLKVSAYGAYISLWDPNPGHVPLRANGYNGAFSLGDFSYPAVAIGYDWANDTFSVGGGIAGAPVDTVTANAPYNGADPAEIAFIFYLHGKVNIGDLWVALNAGFEKAPGQFFLYSRTLDDGTTGIGGTGVKDFTIEGYVEAGYNTPIGALAGTVALVQTIADVGDNGTALQAGVSLAIPLTDNVAIIPGVIYQNLLATPYPDKENWAVQGGVTFTVAF